VPVNLIPFDIKKESTIGAYQCLSSKDIDRRPKGPPVFRQVTVRYLWVIIKRDNSLISDLLFLFYKQCN